MLCILSQTYLDKNPIKNPRESYMRSPYGLVLPFHLLLYFIVWARLVTEGYLILKDSHLIEGFLYIIDLPMIGFQKYMFTIRWCCTGILSLEILYYR